jgi:hypothetical protein
MTRILFDLPPDVQNALWGHLLPEGGLAEQVAFVFARADRERGDHVFRFMEWLPVHPDGLDASSPYYLELTDEMRARVIKTAYDLGATIAEFHSHLGPWPAAFSESDRAGFDEFVPHVWWRLGGKGYLAVVVAASGFDALAWLTGPRSPEPVSAIRSGGKLLRPTGLTLEKWRTEES